MQYESEDSNANGLSDSMLDVLLIDLHDTNKDDQFAPDMVPQEAAGRVYADKHCPLRNEQISLLKTRHQATQDMINIGKKIQEILSQVEQNRLRAIASGARGTGLNI